MTLGDDKSKGGELQRASVYEEAVSMLTGALVIYLFADLRDMARKGEILVSLRDLEPPLTAQQVIKIIGGNEQALSKRAIDHENLKKRLEALNSMKDRGKFLNFFHGTSKESQTILTHFVDTKAEDEIVHAIVVNDEQKRITVIFRGSVTKKDFMQDGKIMQHKIKNPVASLIEDEEYKTEDVKIHTGFWEYLLKKEENSGANRLEQILSEVKKILQERNGYSLYCCGHSLGGALCTLFGFFASANDEIQSLSNDGPVVVYSIASPYVGNWKFKYAFEHLERTKRLQHLRIANLEDMVTMLPFFTPKLSALSPALSMVKGGANLYLHCGIRLQMKAGDGANNSKASHTISYQKNHQANNEEYAEEVKDALNQGKSLASAFYLMMRRDFDKITHYHSCEEYEKRLDDCKEILMSIKLDDLYQDTSIIGNLMSEDYEPKKEGTGGYARAKRAVDYFSNSWSQRKNQSLTPPMLY